MFYICPMKNRWNFDSHSQDNSFAAVDKIKLMLVGLIVVQHWFVGTDTFQCIFQIIVGGSSFHFNNLSL